MEAENIETANSPKENTNGKWEALGKSNPYAELYTSELAGITHDQELEKKGCIY